MPGPRAGWVSASARAAEELDREADEVLAAETVEACRRGDRAALEAVFAACAPVLDRVLTRLLGPTVDVEDVLQQTFAEAIVAFARFRGDARVGTWLCSIAVHQAYRVLRRPERRRTVALELVEESAADPASGPDRCAARRQLAGRLYAHLDRIAPRKRIAFVLHALEERSIDEVAALMGATRAATKSRIYWARRALVRQVENDPALGELLSRKETER